MSNYEHCCECNERTGRAGPSDDSLYLGSVGPFCEDCVDTWPDKMTEEYGRLMAMNAELTEEIELLQHALSWKGKMLSAIVNITKGPPEENTLHSTHDAVESVERLQSRVAELYDLIKYAQVESGVCMCGDKMQDHNQASGHSLVDVWDHAVEQIDKGGTSEAFIKRKQADAVESALQSEMAEFRLYNGTKRSGCFAQDLAAYAQRLRNDAGSVRGDL